MYTLTRNIKGEILDNCCFIIMDSQGTSRRSSACSVMSQEELESFGLDQDHVQKLKRTFDQFDASKSGALSVGTVHTILKMMGYHVTTTALQVHDFKLLILLQLFFVLFFSFPAWLSRVFIRKVLDNCTERQFDCD